MTITLGGPAIATGNGSVTLATDAFGNQVIVYTPNPDFNGIDSLIYTTSDGNGGSDTATLTINVVPRNDAPTADALANLTNNDSDAVSVGLAPFFHDIDTPDGDSLSFSAAGLPVGLSINPATGIVSGTIDKSASQAGPYTIVVTATDLAGVKISSAFVCAVNNPKPTASGDTKTLVEGVNAVVLAANGVLSNDVDPDADPLSVTAINGVPSSVGLSVAGTAGGLFTINADGSYTFDQNGAFEDLQFGHSRQTTITYSISDGNGGYSVADLTITVTG